MREIVLDTETTGLDPKTGDRVVEIGCVEMVNRFLTGRSYHCYINPERSMPPDAFKVHGLSDGFLKDKPKFAEVAQEFLDFIEDATLVIHNAQFDIGFLNHELKRLGKPPLASDRVLCSYLLARRKHPGAPASLDALCQRYSVDSSRRTKHGALLDAELLAEVYAELSGGRQQSMGFSVVPEMDAAELAAVKGRRPPPSLLTEAERDRHRAFIEQLGPKAAWRPFLGLDT